MNDNTLYISEEMIETLYIRKDKIKNKLNQITKEYYENLKKDLPLYLQNLNAQRYDAMRIVLEELLS